jgi:hypothetical protein
LICGTPAVTAQAPIRLAMTAGILAVDPEAVVARTSLIIGDNAVA